MKANILKSVLTTAALVLAAGSASSALAADRGEISAQTITPPQTLGDGASATDVWVATCPAGETGLSADVLDRADFNNPTLVSVQIVKDNAATNITAPDEGLAGPVTLNKEAGAYTVVFDKSGDGIDDYDSIILCQPGSTDPTSLLLIQNQ